MSFKGGKWKAIDLQGINERDAEENVMEDEVRFGVEEMEGEYEVVNNQLILKEGSSSQKKKKNVQSAKSKEKAVVTADKQLAQKATKTVAADKRKAKIRKQSTAVKDAEATEDREEQESDVMSEGEEANDAATGADTDAVEEELPQVDLPEWQVFELHPYLLKGIEKMGFRTPTPIQKLCLPAVLLKGKDVMGVAETGSGKTLAYGLPILSFLISNPPKKSEGLPALIVTPTRELAMQIVEHLRNALTEVPLKLRPRVDSIVGGMSEQKQERVLSKMPEIIVATMGRLKAWIGRHDHLGRLKETLRFLVVDEADRMTDRAHYSDILPLLDALHYTEEEAKKFRRRQTLLFSATLLNTEDDKLQDTGSMSKKAQKQKKNKPSGPFALMEKLGRRGEPLICSVAQGDVVLRADEVKKMLKEEAENSKKKVPSSSKVASTTEESGKVKSVADDVAVKLPDSIKFFRIDCTEEDKEAFLHWILLNGDKGSAILVFVNTINAGKRLQSTLSLSFPDYVVATLHANMEQKQRLRHLDRFKGKSDPTRDKTRVLIASDVAARGLDIPDVDMVVHYGIPPRIDTFVHRSGRCGRAGRSGTVVALCSGLDTKAMGKIRVAIAPRQLEPYPTKELELKKVQARVRVCKQLAKLLNEQRDAHLDKAWKKRAAEADLEVGSDLDEPEDAEANDVSLNRAIVIKEKTQEMEQMQYEIARLRRELAFILSKKAEIATMGGQHRRGRKRAKMY